MLGEAGRESGEVVGELDEAAADVDAVQRALEEGPQLALDLQQGAGLGQGDGVGTVRQPLGLFEERGPEEVPEVPPEGVGAVQPALVAAQSVGVEAEQEVPGGVGAFGERGVGEGAFGEPEDGAAADGLVGVRGRDDEGLPGAVPDGEQPQGGARAGGADLGEPGVAGMGGDERGGAGAQLVDGRVALVWRQSTPPRVRAPSGSLAVRDVRTVSHGCGGTSTPHTAKGDDGRERGRRGRGGAHGGGGGARSRWGRAPGSGRSRAVPQGPDGP